MEGKRAVSMTINPVSTTQDSPAPVVYARSETSPPLSGSAYVQHGDYVRVTATGEKALAYDPDGDSVELHHLGRVWRVKMNEVEVIPG